MGARTFRIAGVRCFNLLNLNFGSGAVRISTGVCQIGKLWETVGMANRTLRISNQVTGAPTSGFCTACGARFMSRLKDIGDAREQLRSEFGGHNCKEDASQAAARIVKEATEGH
jgi:hypothetical protein